MNLLDSKISWMFAAVFAGLWMDSSRASPVSLTTKWISRGGYSKVRETPLNSDNQTLELPDALLAQEARLDLEIQYGRRLRLSVSPRMILLSEFHHHGEWTNRSRIQGRWNQFYLEANSSRTLRFSVGIQNFKWGPSDWMSPTNILSSTSGFESNLIFETEGIWLLRLNKSFGQNVSLIVMADVDPNQDEDMLPESDSNSGLLKLEFNSSNGSFYLGGVLASRETSPWASGFYGSFELLDGLSVYADALWEPSRKTKVFGLNEDLPQLVEVETEGDLDSLVLSGVSYHFVEGWTLKAEHIFNSKGLTDSEMASGKEIVSDVPGSELLWYSRLQEARFQLMGTQYLFASVLSPYFGPDGRFRLQSRHLLSLQDESSRHILNFDAFLTGQLEVFLTLLTSESGGDTFGELSFDQSYGVQTGLVYSW